MIVVTTEQRAEVCICFACGEPIEAGRPVTNLQIASPDLSEGYNAPVCDRCAEGTGKLLIERPNREDTGIRGFHTGFWRYYPAEHGPH